MEERKRACKQQRIIYVWGLGFPVGGSTVLVPMESPIIVCVFHSFMPCLPPVSLRGREVLVASSSIPAPLA